MTKLRDKMEEAGISGVAARLRELARKALKNAKGDVKKASTPMQRAVYAEPRLLAELFGREAVTERVRAYLQDMQAEESQAPGESLPIDEPSLPASPNARGGNGHALRESRPTAAPSRPASSKKPAPRTKISKRAAQAVAVDNRYQVKFGGREYNAAFLRRKDVINGERDGQKIALFCRLVHEEVPFPDNDTYLHQLTSPEHVQDMWKRTLGALPKIARQ